MTVPDSKGRIPLCQSSFLQDLSIAVGRRSLKSLRYATACLKFQTSKDIVNGSELERFDAEARTYLGTMTKVTVWENKSAWMYFRECEPSRAKAVTKKIFASLNTMEAPEIAELIVATLRDASSTLVIWEKLNALAK